MAHEDENALKAEDVAKILKIGRNAVYEMAKSGELRSYHIGRKLRFTYTDIEDYINASRMGGNSSQIPLVTRSPQIVAPQQRTVALGSNTPGANTFLVCGQDPVLDVLNSYAERRGAHVLRSSINSMDALIALYKGEANAACCNLLDLESNTYNIPFVKRMLPGNSCIVIHLAKRMQGFYVAKGNPKAIVSWQDLARRDVQFVNREKGSGTRLLVDAKLKERAIETTHVNGYSRVVTNEMALASMVVRGVADVAIGRQVTAAQTEGLDFVPLFNESYDMVMTQDSMETEEGQALLAIIKKGELKRAFAFVAGYDTIATGQYTFVSA